MYDIYRVILSKDEYFSNWKKVNLEAIPEERREQIYREYVAKAITFQEAGFKCENEFCDSPLSKLTYHHIKFAKNGGRYTRKNGACICNSCQKGYHSAKEKLKIRGHIYQLHEAVMREKDEYPDEEMSSKMRQKKIRKMNKEFHGIRISPELMRILIEFLMRS